jgi:hypothetical protein
MNGSESTKGTRKAGRSFVMPKTAAPHSYRTCTHLRGKPLKTRVSDKGKKTSWGRSSVQLVRTLLSHRHNDVSDLKISNLLQPTSVRPVTASAISLHFRKLVVRSLEVPDVFLLRDRSASRMANSFRQELIAELFDEES